MDIYVFNYPVYNIIMDTLAMEDFKYILLCLLTVMVYMFIHTKSITLTLIGVY